MGMKSVGGGQATLLAPHSKKWGGNCPPCPSGLWFPHSTWKYGMAQQEWIRLQLKYCNYNKHAFIW